MSVQTEERLAVAADLFIKQIRTKLAYGKQQVSPSELMAMLTSVCEEKQYTYRELPSILLHMYVGARRLQETPFYGVPRYDLSDLMRCAQRITT